MTTKRQRQRDRNRCEAPPPKFVPGTRVVVDFEVGGKVSGLTRRQYQVPGLVVGVRGRFLRTEDMALWMYVVRLDREFCSVEQWTLSERHLSKERRR